MQWCSLNPAEAAVLPKPLAKGVCVVEQPLCSFSETMTIGMVIFLQELLQETLASLEGGAGSVPL